jgi:hypothetical protein
MRPYFSQIYVLIIVNAQAQTRLELMGESCDV